MKKITVSASVVVHDSPAEELRTLLECLSHSDVDAVWVVYNGENSRFDRELEPFDIIFRKVDNNGYGAGHNIAIREALERGSKYHIVVNPDIRWHGDIVSPMKSYMETHTEVGILAPRIINPDGSPQYNARQLPSPFDLLARRLLPPSLKRRHDRRYLMHDQDYKRELNAPYLLGCFMFFRTEAIHSCGLFDERFFMYPEDIDITRRFHRKWSTIRWNGVSAEHFHRRESAHSLRMLRIHIINMIRYFRKWGWINDRERKAMNSSCASHANRSWLI